MNQANGEPCVYTTAHYVFHYRKGSLAQRDIQAIAQEQEACYARITSALGVRPDFPLQYHLFDTADEVGAAYGDNEPCNGFASPPDTVYAVYGEKVKCIGMHEDTHLISYVRGRPASAFIREGLAMYMDKVWWGKPNEAWTRDFIADGRYLRVECLLSNEEFYAHDDALTYPIAGAFTAFMVSRLGMQAYLDAVYYAKLEPSAAIERAFDQPLFEVERAFMKWLGESSGT